MSPTNTAPTPIVASRPQAALAEPAAGPGGLTVAHRAFVAELVKLRSVRSTGVVLLLTALSLMVVGVVNAVGMVVGTRNAGAEPATLDPLGGALSGVGPAAIAVTVLGVLAVTADYSSGMIRTTLAAVPRRALVVLGKVAAVAVLVFPVSVGAALLTFVANQVILASVGLSISLGHPGVSRAILGAGLYLTVLSAFAAGLGWLVRSTAGALGCWLAIWVVPSFVILLLPPATAARVHPYLPSNVGQLVTEIGGSSEAAAWGSLAILVGYAAAVTALGALVLRHRDA